MDAPLEIDHCPKHQEGPSTPPQVSQQSELTTTKKVGNGPAQLPVHPFTGAKDVAYSPPTTNNVTAKPKPLLPKKVDMPPKTFAPVYNPQIASDIYT